MTTYQIRVIRKDRGAKVFNTPQTSDYAAIRRARLLAQEGDIVEVWRGLNCVFIEAPEDLRLH